MGDVRFLSHVRLRRAARARLDQLRRPPGPPDQETTEGETVHESEPERGR